MKTIRYRKHKIEKVINNYEDNNYVFIANYKTVLYNYIVDDTRLSFDDHIAMHNFKEGTHDLMLVSLEGEFVELHSERKLINFGKAIDKYIEKEYDPILYINYKRFNCFTQLDGITTIVGMSGAGKTFSAIDMLPTYANHFDKIAYINYELPDRDIISRLDDHFPAGATRKKIVEKLYIKDGIATNLCLTDYLDAMEIKPDDKIVFIIDNVGSVIGQGNDVWNLQNEFLKELDMLVKANGWHALALTQMIKDHNISLFDDNGNIKESITMSIMSGSIMLGNLSRSVLFTAYNGETNEFLTKVLKRGTGKFYHELEKEASKNEYITTK